MKPSRWSPWRYLLRYSQQPVKITESDFYRLLEQQSCCCALSGVPIEFATTLHAAKHGSGTASLDRIDSGVGYVAGNVQWLHKKINWMKHTLEVSRFVEWCARVAHWLGGVYSQDYHNQISLGGLSASLPRRPPCFASIWNQVKTRAKRKGHVLAVTPSQAIDLLEQQQYRCRLSGSPISLMPRKMHIAGYSTASLDRIDSSQGYLLENVQWVHRDVNFMKNNLSELEFVGLCAAVARFQRQRR